MRVARAFTGAGLLAGLCGGAGCWLVRSNADLDGPADAGMQDVGAEAVQGDAGTDAPITACKVGSILCEDFEHPLAAYWQNGNFPSTSTTTVDTTSPAAHGKGSLRAHVDPVNANVQGPPSAVLIVDQDMTHPLPLPYYERVFVKVASGGLIQTRAGVGALLTAAETTGNYDFLELRAAGPAMSKTFALANTFDNVLPLSATALPFDSWHCVEWEIAASSMKVWLDGAPIDDLSVTTAVKPVWGEGFGYVNEATAAFTSTVGQDVWVDEIIINDAPIGCSAFQE